MISKNKLDIYLNFDTNANDFSIQSFAILSLINYFELSNENVNLYCVIDQNNGEIDIEKYSDIVPVRYIKIMKLSQCEQHVQDVSLPCAVRFSDDNLFIVYTGLAGLYRIITKCASKSKLDKSIMNLLGYKYNCLKTCSEVSKWTHLCETVPIEIYEKCKFNEIKTEFADVVEDTLQSPLHIASKKCPKNVIKIRYLLDYTITISDLLVYLFLNIFSTHFDLNNYENIKEWKSRLEDNDKKLSRFTGLLSKYNNICKNPSALFEKLNLNDKENEVHKINMDDKDVNLVFANFQDRVKQEYKIEIPFPTDNSYTEEDIKINWNEFNSIINPSAGKLPEKRVDKKCQQLENFLFLIKRFVDEKSFKPNLTVVDFCSGGGHLAILLAYFYPNFIVKMIDNKEESLKLAMERIKKLKLTNIFVYKGNLNNFVGKFDLGVAIHACGSATDLVIQKCVLHKAHCITAPCCYGAIKDNDLIKYPRSKIYSQAINFDYKYLANYSDRTERNTRDENTAYLCMKLVDTDRGLYFKENNYKTVLLGKLLPETCTLKNNLIAAIYN